MSSTFAQRFHQHARALLWREHGEIVTYHDDDGSSRPLPVTWRRVNPQGDDHDGQGLDRYRALATAIVRMADLAEPHGGAELERAGERWAIRLIEVQDEWTWKLHLALPDDDLRLPEGMRR